MKSNLLIIGTLVTLSACHHRTDHPAADGRDSAGINAAATGKVAKIPLSMVVNRKDLSCGMPLTAGIGDTVRYGGKLYGFCSKECKEDFLKDPKAHLAQAK